MAVYYNNHLNKSRSISNTLRIEAAKSEKGLTPNTRNKRVIRNWSRITRKNNPLSTRWILERLRIERVKA